MKIESRLETKECAAADNIGGFDIFQQFDPNGDRMLTTGLNDTGPFLVYRILRLEQDYEDGSAYWNNSVVRRSERGSKVEPSSWIRAHFLSTEFCDWSVHLPSRL
nr:unnamed protein product [Haemonchus contortus]